MSIPTTQCIEARTRVTRDGISIYKRYEGDNQYWYHTLQHPRPDEGKRKAAKFKLSKDIEQSFFIARQIRIMTEAREARRRVPAVTRGVEWWENVVNNADPSELGAV